MSNNVPINDAQRVMGHEKATTLLDLCTHGSGDGGQRLRDTAADDLLTDDLLDDRDEEGEGPQEPA